MIKLPYNILFNNNYRKLYKSGDHINWAGGNLNEWGDALRDRSEKILRVRDSFPAFLKELRADGLTHQDILEVLEMMKRR